VGCLLSYDRLAGIRRTIVLFICLVCAVRISYSQPQTLAKSDLPREKANTFALYGGMGVKLGAAPAMVDYINTIADPSQRASDFATDIEFFGGTEFPLNAEWGGALEYAYLFKSYTLPTTNAGTYTLFYNIHMPTAIVQYVVPGRGYFMKFGGGIGYHVGSVEQSNSMYGTDSTYTARGIGIKAHAVGETAFDEHLLGYISGDIRWEFFGKLKNSGGNELRNLGQTASLSMFVIGIGFGLIYYF
jgi:hypothetical protein